MSEEFLTILLKFLNSFICLFSNIFFPFLYKNIAHPDRSPSLDKPTENPQVTNFCRFGLQSKILCQIPVFIVKFFFLLIIQIGISFTYDYLLSSYLLKALIEELGAKTA